MSTKYKVPHTARFLQTFHAAAQRAGVAADDNQAEYNLAAADLLNEVPVDAPPADLRTEGQIRFMENLISDITALSLSTGAQAREYTNRMTEHGRWTPGREGNASAWIDRMIAKRDALKVMVTPVAPVTLPVVADGRYAVEHGGVLKFYRVKNGRKPGFVFIDVQAGDELHPIRRADLKAEILNLIMVDPHAALVRYGRELGVCGRCSRTLTDEESRAAGIGPICSGKL